METCKGSDLSLTVLIPVHNEEGSIRGTLAELYGKCLNQLTNFELILLEDGSADRTAEVLHECEQQFPNLKASTQRERIGYRAIVSRGIQMASKEWILLMDGDGQIEPADIWALLACAADHDIVTAIKFPRCDPVVRIMISRCFDIITDMILGISIRDINFGFKLMRTRLAQDIAPRCGKLGEIFTAEMVIRFVYMGYRLNQIRVRHHKRLVGPSQGIPSTRLLGRSLKTFKGLLDLRRELAADVARR